MSLQNHYSFLRTLGWDDLCEDAWGRLSRENLVPARVVGQEKTLYRVQFSKDLIVPAAVTGKLWNDQGSTEDLPAVGDWVACSVETSEGGAQIHSIFPRKTILQRMRPGTTPFMQLIAANVDYMFITTSLNEDFNIRRIDRYIKVAHEGGVTPILVLTKSDLSHNKKEILENLKNEFPELPVHFLRKRTLILWKF
jgi:ribosome biogenesis GTPase